MKHTPGPWKVEYLRGTGRRFRQTDVYVSTDKGALAKLFLPANGITKEANAHLIAAAPEMLEALELAEDTLDIAANEHPSFITIRDIIRNVIAKARGES